MRDHKKDEEPKAEAKIENKREKVEDLFNRLHPIQSGVLPSMRQIRERVAGDSQYESQARAICDKLRYMIRCQKHEAAVPPYQHETEEEKFERFGIADDSNANENLEEAADGKYQLDEKKSLPDTIQDQRTVLSDSCARYKYSEKDNIRISCILRT